MARSVSAYFLDELFSWNDSLIFHLEETEELEELLQEVLQMNTLPGIGEKVEHELAALSIVSQVLHTLKHQVSLLQKELRQQTKTGESGKLTLQMQENQKTLRANMLKGEKDFLDTRYRCNDFIADMVCRQNDLHKDR